MAEDFKPFKLNIAGGVVAYFVAACHSLEEAQKALPDLTREQFDKIRRNEATFIGTTNTGIEYVELNEDGTPVAPSV